MFNPLSIFQGISNLFDWTADISPVIQPKGLGLGVVGIDVRTEDYMIAMLLLDDKVVSFNPGLIGYKTLKVIPEDAAWCCDKLSEKGIWCECSYLG